MRMMLTILAALASFLLASPETVQAQLMDRTPGLSLDPVLQPYLAQYDLPALAAAVVRNGTIVVAAGAVGTRRAGTDIPVTVDDRFHIGSDT